MRGTHILLRLATVAQRRCPAVALRVEGRVGGLHFNMGTILGGFPCSRERRRWPASLTGHYEASLVMPGNKSSVCGGWCHSMWRQITAAGAVREDGNHLRANGAEVEVRTRAWPGASTMNGRFIHVPGAGWFRVREASAAIAAEEEAYAAMAAEASTA